MKHISEIQIRDPFIVPENGKYFMFGTTDPDIWNAEGQGFDVYVTEDLENFIGPVNVFSKSDDFWGEKNFWAPEVHKYNGRYYMFATFYGNGKRGSHLDNNALIITAGKIISEKNGIIRKLQINVNRWIS